MAKDYIIVGDKNIRRTNKFIYKNRDVEEFRTKDVIYFHIKNDKNLMYQMPIYKGEKINKSKDLNQYIKDINK